MSLRVTGGEWTEGVGWHSPGVRAGAFFTLLGQSIQGSSIIWDNVRPEWWWSLKSLGKVKPVFGCNFKSDMLVNRQLNWPAYHFTVILHPLVESQRTELSQNIGSRVEAHLQVDNQQQVLFLWFLVHLNIRRREGISNALNLKREGRNCEIFNHMDWGPSLC